MGKDSERGSTLLMVSMILMIIVVMSSALLLTAQQSVAAASQGNHSNQSQMNARNGIEVIEQKADSVWTSLVSGQPTSGDVASIVPNNNQSFLAQVNAYIQGLSGAPFTASINQQSVSLTSTPATITYLLTVTGTDGPSSTKLQATMTAKDPMAAPTLLNDVINAGNNMYLLGDPAIHGNTDVAKDFYLLPNPFASASGKAVIDGALRIHGDAYSLFGWPQWDKDSHDFLHNSSLSASDLANDINIDQNSISLGANVPQMITSEAVSAAVAAENAATLKVAKDSGSYKATGKPNADTLPANGGYDHFDQGAPSYHLRTDHTVTGPLYFDGNLTIDAGVTLTVDGPLFIDGSLTVNGQLKATHAVYVNGNTYVFTTTPSTSPLEVVSNGDIVVAPIDFGDQSADDHASGTPAIADKPSLTAEQLSLISAKNVYLDDLYRPLEIDGTIASGQDVIVNGETGMAAGVLQLLGEMGDSALNRCFSDHKLRDPSYAALTDANPELKVVYDPSFLTNPLPDTPAFALPSAGSTGGLIDWTTPVVAQ